jgi:hypothetical protein
MDLSELDWRPACCSDHLTATATVGDVAINIQRDGDVFGVTLIVSGLFVRAERSVSESRVLEVIASL